MSCDPDHCCIRNQNQKIPNLCSFVMYSRGGQINNQYPVVSVVHTDCNGCAVYPLEQDSPPRPQIPERIHD